MNISYIESVIRNPNNTLEHLGIINRWLYELRNTFNDHYRHREYIRLEQLLFELMLVLKYPIRKSKYKGFKIEASVYETRMEFEVYSGWSNGEDYMKGTINSDESTDINFRETSNIDDVLELTDEIKRLAVEYGVLD